MSIATSILLWQQQNILTNFQVASKQPYHPKTPCPRDLEEEEDIVYILPVLFPLHSHTVLVGKKDGCWAISLVICSVWLDKVLSYSHWGGRLYSASFPGIEELLCDWIIILSFSSCGGILGRSTPQSHFPDAVLFLRPPHPISPQWSFHHLRTI